MRQYPGNEPSCYQYSISRLKGMKTRLPKGTGSLEGLDFSPRMLSELEDSQFLLFGFHPNEKNNIVIDR